jgi:hypothetical protein
MDSEPEFVSKTEPVEYFMTYRFSSKFNIDYHFNKAQVCRFVVMEIDKDGRERKIGWCQT